MSLSLLIQIYRKPKHKKTTYLTIYRHIKKTNKKGNDFINITNSID